jgi:hypothetical protein
VKTLNYGVIPMRPSSSDPRLLRFARVRVGLGRPGQQRSTPNVRRIALRSAQRDRGVTHCAASVSGRSRRELDNRCEAALPIRSPPRQA